MHSTCKDGLWSFVIIVISVIRSINMVFKMLLVVNTWVVGAHQLIRANWLQPGPMFSRLPNMNFIKISLLNFPFIFDANQEHLVVTLPGFKELLPRV